MKNQNQKNYSPKNSRNELFNSYAEYLGRRDLKFSIAAGPLRAFSDAYLIESTIGSNPSTC